MTTTGRLSSDRREHLRAPLASRVTFYHVPSQRTYSARSVDVSAGGMLLYVPAATPVAPGQEIELSVEAPDRPDLAALHGRLTLAKIVRVDREKMLQTGHLPVAVQFTPRR